jgi:hypothetical protein
MKKIILFILILISFKALAQYPVNTAVGNASQLQYQNGAYGARLGYVFKDAFGDTTAANLSFIKNVPGQVIRVGNTLWMRNTALTAWIQIGSADLSGYLLKADSSLNGGYYPYATNPKSYLVAADISGKLNYSDTAAMKLQRDSDTTLWDATKTDLANALIGLGSPNSNIGAGYRLAVPNTNNIKTLFNGYSVLIDSSSNTNGLTFKVDTANISTKAYAQSLVDASGGGDNIYNTDGTLTGDRGVTLDGHSLNFINGTGNLILWGDGTTQLQSPSFFGGYNTFVQGNTYPGEFQINPTSSSGVSTMISLVRNHSTTGSAGVGVSIDFKPPTSGGGSTLANRFISKWATVTHASRTSEVDITGVNNATDETYMNIQTSGIVRVNNNADTLLTKAEGRDMLGSGSGGSGLNIYNTDSSLASDRTINGNDKFFHLDSTLNFQLGVKKQAGRYSETYGTYNTLGGYSYFDSKELAGFEATNTSNNSNIIIEAQGAADESYSKVHVYPDSIRITTPQLIINGSIYGAPSVTTSSSTSLTLTVTGSSTKSYFFTGSSAATWTLPAIGTTGQKISIKNRGSANVVVQRAGANEIYTTEAITSITMYPGDELELQDDGTYWNYLN